MNSGRRRTDIPDALLHGVAADFSDHPTQAGRDRSERRDSLLTAGPNPERRRMARSAAGVPAEGMPAAGVLPRGDAGQISRSRLPLPPVPAASRGAGPAAPAARAGGSMATAAPSGAEHRPVVPGGSVVASAPPAERRSGRSGPRAGRISSSGPLARVPRPASPEELSHGAWTAADGTMRGESIRRSPEGNAATERSAGDLLVRPAPLAAAIPERSIAVDRGRSSAAADDGDQAPEGVPGPRTGRAAMRAERQAADMARRKAVKRSGGPVSALPEDDKDEVRKPRGIVKGLAAMAVVGLGVLGVYTVAAPVPQDAASSISQSAPSAAPISQLPPLPTEPVAAEPTVAAPVRVPVTVLNATDIDGLAGKISATVVDAGWESPGVGAYEGDDVAVSTVFFTEGDENQRQAALQLIEQFPQLSGPAPRFFELPADVTVPGLVVVAAGEWVP